MKRHLIIDPSDNVAVALANLPAGEPLRNGGQTTEPIPQKQKVALQSFAEGDTVRMYGVTVGRATDSIPAGGLLSTKNVAHASDSFSQDRRRSGAPAWQGPDVGRWKESRFLGYKRSNGSVGTANYWIVVPMVFCENRNLQTMRQATLKALGYDRSDPYTRFMQGMVELHRSGAEEDRFDGIDLQEDSASAQRVFPNVDGVKFLQHGMGCGGTRDDANALCALLAGYITHPNVAGATVLSLGCQNAEVVRLEEEIAKRDPSFDRPLQIFVQQKSRSEKAMLAEALKGLFLGVKEANKLQRQPSSLSKLTLGLECGGSDGFSGISANPVLGRVSDLLVALGAKTILSEFPELCGVEQELIDRCASSEIGARLEDLMRRYSARAEAVGSGFHMNPSPGNIADGLITDAIKSAGAAKKGGTSPVVDVLDYTEPVRKDGLNLLCTPGNDVESTTAMAGSGANLMIFTTGLGTPTGNPVCPTLKVSSNTDLARRMSDIIDFDTGPVIRGEATIEDLGGQLLDLAIETASGRYTPHSVRLGQDDFLPWKRGVSL